MSYAEEKERAYREQARKINDLYARYKGSQIQGQLDGEPWAEEELKLKKDFLERLNIIKKKYNK